MRTAPFVALAICACSSPAPPMDAGTDAIVVSDASAIDAYAMPTPWVATYGATFHASLEAQTPTEIEHALLEDNLGAMTISGDTRAAFSPQTVDWASAGFRLVHLYSVDDDDLGVSFVYCQSDAVVSVWYESLRTPLYETTDVGSFPCTVTTGAHDVVVEQRAFERIPDDIHVVENFLVEGDTVHSGVDGRGTLSLADVEWTSTVFGFVDCYASLCGAPGWYELHTLLRGPDGETGFVIYYLMHDDTEHVRTGYGLRFDELGDLPNVQIAAHWENTL